MEIKNRLTNKLWCLFLLLCITKVCHSQLMCYVCENCAEVNMATPQFECNEDFFNKGGSTDLSIQTTTELAATSVDIDSSTSTTEKLTTTTTEESTTTTTTTTTKEMPNETTTEAVTETTPEITSETTTTEEVTETTTITEAQPPLPSTVASNQTTTSMPTPLNPRTVKPIDDVEKLNSQSGAHDQKVNKDEVDDIDVDQKATNKTYKPSAEFRVRQLRSVNDVTYHCYKVHATTVNGTMVVNRGCSRVKTAESVCGQWQEQHPSEQVSKCYPCSRTKCNGSSALNISITALIVAVVAVFMQRK